MNKLKISGLIVVGALALAACDKPKTEEKKATPTTVATPIVKEDVAFKYSLTDGFGLCASKLKAKLGDAIKISNLHANYAVPDDIAAHQVMVGQKTKGGELESCDLKMQSPDDAKKLVGYRLNTKTDEIEGPTPVEITVAGNAEKFNLNDAVFPIGSFDFAAAQATVDGLKPKLEEKFSKYQVRAVYTDRDMMNGKPKIGVTIDGVLKANGIKKSVWMTMTADGKKITAGDFK